MMKITKLRHFVRRNPAVGLPAVGLFLAFAWMWKRKHHGVVFLGFCVLVVLTVHWIQTATMAQRQGKDTPAYRVTDLGVLNGDVGSGANAINERGEVVGWSGELYNHTHAILWSNGNRINLHVGPERCSEARAININGEVVGWYGNNSQTLSHPCLWREGTRRDLSAVDGCTFGHANEINDKGHIVGGYYDTEHGTGKGYYACEWSHGEGRRLDLSLNASRL